MTAAGNLSAGRDEMGRNVGTMLALVLPSRPVPPLPPLALPSKFPPKPSAVWGSTLLRATQILYYVFRFWLREDSPQI